MTNRTPSRRPRTAAPSLETLETLAAPSGFGFSFVDIDVDVRAIQTNASSVTQLQFALVGPGGVAVQHSDVDQTNAILIG